MESRVGYGRHFALQPTPHVPGIYQRCGEQRLRPYLAEREFRYDNRVANGVDDRQRADNALAGIVGKRLTYARPHLDA